MQQNIISKWVSVANKDAFIDSKQNSPYESVVCSWAFQVCSLQYHFMPRVGQDFSVTMYNTAFRRKALKSLITKLSTEP